MAELVPGKTSILGLQMAAFSVSSYSFSLLCSPSVSSSSCWIRAPPALTSFSPKCLLKGSISKYSPNGELRF